MCIRDSRYNVVVKGIDMHEPGTLNPTYYDGIIVLSQRNEDLAFMEEVMDKNIPMVVICRTVFLDVPNVTTDESRAVEKAMDYLLENGHKNIGVIEGDPRLDSTRLRHRGWRAAAEAHGLDPERIPVEYGNYRFTSGYQAARKLLEQELTAILCFNDEMAFGAREAIVELGLKVDVYKRQRHGEPAQRPEPEAVGQAGDRIAPEGGAGIVVSVVIQTITRIPHVLPYIAELPEDIPAVFASVVLHLVLHIKWKRHVKPVQPDLIGVNLLVPEISALRAGLGLQLAVNEIDTLPVLRLSGQVV